MTIGVVPMEVQGLKEGAFFLVNVSTGEISIEIFDPRNKLEDAFFIVASTKNKLRDTVSGAPVHASLTKGKGERGEPVRTGIVTVEFEQGTIQKAVPLPLVRGCFQEIPVH